MSSQATKSTDKAAFNCLKGWAETYLRHRDATLKKIAEIKDTLQGMCITNNDGTSADCTVLPSLGNQLSTAETGRQQVIVTLNNEENIKEVCGRWDSLSADRTLLIIFANPLSATEDKWVLKPNLHNKVCDRKSLMQGLKAMSELVEQIDEETLALTLREKQMQHFSPAANQ